MTTRETIQDGIAQPPAGTKGAGTLAFDIAEYDARVRKTKEAMQTRGIDVLLCVNPSNMCYLSGYDSWSFYVHQAVVVALEERHPIWIGRGMDAVGAKVTTYLDDRNILPYPDDYVQSTVKHPMDFVADFLKTKGWDRGSLGVEMDAYYFTAAAYETLKSRLPNATFKDGHGLVNWIRVIKSAREIEYMTQAARIVENAIAAAVDAIHPGNRQCDAAAAIYRAQISGTPEFGGEYTAIVPMLPTGSGTATPHLTWNDSRFVLGEATILELAGCRRRYHCPQARTVHIGKPPQRLVDTAEIVVEGLNAALDAAKPGATCEQVEAAWSRSIRRHGLEKESRIGYSTGLSYPPDWGEHTLSLRPGDKTELRPGMTIHMIPGIWMDDWGIEISECFRVTETGAEPFCTNPRRLFIKD